MFSKDMKLGYLLTFYRDLLDERACGIMTSYYEDDLSLSEIAEGVGISRQGVRHIIKRAEEQLLFFEDKLHFARIAEAQYKSVGALRALTDELRCDERFSSLVLRLDAILAELPDMYKN